MRVYRKGKRRKSVQYPFCTEQELTVLRTLKQGDGPIGCYEVAVLAGLSASTAFTLLRRLIEAGHVERLQPEKGQRWRPKYIPSVSGHILLQCATMIDETRG